MQRSQRNIRSGLRVTMCKRKPASRSYIRAAFAELRESDGLLAPIRLRIVRALDGGGSVGQADADARGLVLTMALDQCEQCACDTMLHEWAHLRCIARYGRACCDHGPRWGREYARLYRLMHKTE